MFKAVIPFFSFISGNRIFCFRHMITIVFEYLVLYMVFRLSSANKNVLELEIVVFQSNFTVTSEAI